MRPRHVALPILALLLLATAAPLAGAHGGSHGDSDGTPTPTEGAHPGRHGYDSYKGQRFWGEVTRIPLPDRRPEDPAMADGWMVWLADGPRRTDVLAYDLDKEVRVQVTDDEPDQHDPAIHGDRIVWTEDVGTAGRVVTHDLSTGRRDVIVNTSGIKRNPDIGDRYVAWQDRRGGSWDVYAHDLRTGRTFPVGASGDREVDPAVVDGHVAWRHEKFGHWDIFVENMTTGRETRVTADKGQERDLQAGEDALYYLDTVRGQQRYKAVRHYPAADQTEALGLTTTLDDAFTPVGGSILYLQPYVRNRTLAIQNPGPDESTRLHTGRLDIDHGFDAANRTVALLVDEAGERSLVAYTISPLAWEPSPNVVIEEPGSGDIVSNVTTIRGQVTGFGDYPRPTEVYVLFDTATRWVEAQGTTNWSAVLGLANATSGRHTITVSAEFPDGPPISSRVDVRVGTPLDFTRDFSPYLEQENPSLATAIVSQIPLLLLTILLLVAVILVAVRWYLRWRRQRHPNIEYVRHRDPAPPHDSPVERPDDAPADGSGTDG